VQLTNGLCPVHSDDDFYGLRLLPSQPLPALTYLDFGRAMAQMSGIGLDITMPEALTTMTSLRVRPG
jgi:hypothetical protein